MPAAKSNVLVREYIEKMSGDIFEERYRDQLAELIEGHAGVYALYLDDALYYVGLASDLMRRVGRHQKDRHAGRWNLFSVYLTSKSAHIKPLESLLLRVFMPEGNRVRGKLPNAVDGKRALAVAMRRHDAEKRAAALNHARPVGRTAVRRHAKPVAAAREGRQDFGSLLPRAITLRADYKGKRYTARARKNGEVAMNGRVYGSLSAAASAVTGGPSNGWRFWFYRTVDGEWLPMAELR